MRVSYYCQHVLGVGHLRRSLEICKSLCKQHETTLILGGPDTCLDTAGVTILQLPGLKMDHEFNHLAPCDSSKNLDATKQIRKEQLYNYFQTSEPNCFITELYPFGRKGFRFELDPILAGIKDGELSSCSTVCSVRDILVEKMEGREKFEKRVVQTLNNYYDAVLVHSDPDIVKLQETFTSFSDITTPVYYTGFVSEPIHTASKNSIHNKLGLAAEQKLIVASAGGGGVGIELLKAVIPAFKKLLNYEPKAHLQIFTGPYCSEEHYQDLQTERQFNITIDRFTDHFPDWLAAAALSISFAGYNTCMNVLQTGVPALMYPFRQNREQGLRLEKLRTKAPISQLTSDDLQTDSLCDKMIQQLKIAPATSSINLQGAITSSSLIDQIFS